MWAPTMQSIRGNSADMEGSLMKCRAGADCSDRSSWDVYKKLPKSGGADIMLLSEILHAVTPPDAIGRDTAGFDLDAESDACPRKCHGANSTYRFMGAIFQALIEYDNTGTLIEGSDSENVKYQIKIYHLPHSLFQQQVVQKGSSNQGRTIHYLFGPRIVFSVGGTVGKFQTNSLLLQLSTSIAMFAVATTLVDFLMLYILPNSDFYTHQKYEDVDEEVIYAGNYDKQSSRLSEAKTPYTQLVIDPQVAQGTDTKLNQ